MAASQRFDAFGFDNFGYANTVILPLDVTGHEIGAPVRIIADLEALACADICVPLTGRLELTLPDGEPVAAPHAQTLARFAAMVPRRADADAVSASGPSLRPERVEARDDGLFVSFGEARRRLPRFLSRVRTMSPSRRQSLWRVVTSCRLFRPISWISAPRPLC